MKTWLKTLAEWTYGLARRAGEATFTPARREPELVPVRVDLRSYGPKHKARRRQAWPR